MRFEFPQNHLATFGEGMTGEHQRDLWTRCVATNDSALAKLKRTGRPLRFCRRLPCRARKLRGLIRRTRRGFKCRQEQHQQDVDTRFQRFNCRNVVCPAASRNFLLILRSRMETAAVPNELTLQRNCPDFFAFTGAKLVLTSPQFPGQFPGFWLAFDLLGRA